jgi:hypothetical protein
VEQPTLLWHVADHFAFFVSHRDCGAEYYPWLLFAGLSLEPAIAQYGNAMVEAYAY